MSNVDELLAQGIAELQSAGQFAKASQATGKQRSRGDSLDDDFDGLDSARDASDDSREGDDAFDGDEDEQGYDPDDEGQDDDSDDDDSDEDSEDSQADDGDDDGSGSQGKRMSKAQTVDALPLLQAIDQRLSQLDSLQAEVKSLRRQNTQLAKAVEAQTNGTMLLAKAVNGGLNAPLPPASKRGKVSVPSRVEASVMTASEVMSKAEQAAMNGLMSVQDATILNSLVQRHGVDGAFAQVPQLRAALNKVGK